MRYLLFLLFVPFLYAEEEESYDLNITNHVLELENGPLSYTAITGMCPIFRDGHTEAELFFVAYVKNDAAHRPITFVFPGGPGGAGTVESILAFGPRRLLTADEGRTPIPPYKIIDNPQTLLGLTDLVYVDPVDCGFSRAMEEVDTDDFFSVEGDIQSLGEFVHTYIDIGQRWNSPIYLAGGSYGTLRCCGLALYLLQ